MILLKENVFFSVIMTVYNDKRFISTALNSVIGQSFSDYEILIIDNGSSDGSIGIVENILKDNPSVKSQIIHLETNQGISGGRNSGIENAKGEYICILDADDYWYENKLQEVYNVLSRTKYDVVWHWEDHVKGDDKKTVKYRMIDRNNPYVDLLYNGNCFSPSAMTIRLVKIKDIGGFDVKRVSGEEDYDCWMRLAKSGSTFYLIEKPLGIFLIREDSYSKKLDIHMRGVLGLLEKQFSELSSGSSDSKRIMKDWKKVKSKSLCSYGHGYSLQHKRRKAFNLYLRSIRCNPFNFKAYAGILLSIIYR